MNVYSLVLNTAKALFLFISVVPSVQLGWSQRCKEKSWTTWAVFPRGSTSTKDCKSLKMNKYSVDPALTKMASLVNYDIIFLAE